MIIRVFECAADASILEHNDLTVIIPHALITYGNTAKIKWLDYDLPIYATKTRQYFREQRQLFDHYCKIDFIRCIIHNITSIIFLIAFLIVIIEYIVKTLCY